MDHRERQEARFEDFKKILQKKETNPTAQGYIERLELVFSNHTLQYFAWDYAIDKVLNLDDNELEEFLLRMVKFVEYACEFEDYTD